MALSTYEVTGSQAINRAVLAEGVKGVKCLQSCAREELEGAGALETDQVEALLSVDNMLSKLAGVTMGSIELYANGGMNIYLKQGKNVVGYVIYRR
jgi:hypothetical protein